MTRFISSVSLIAALLAASTAPSSLLAAGATNVYLSAPYTQTAKDSGTTFGGGFSSASVETFEGYAQGGFKSLTSTTLGATLSSTSGSSVNPNSQYGGGNQGQYLGVKTQLTLTFTAPVSYFGLFWCATDAGNSLSLYDQNNSLIGTFNADGFTSVLPNNSTSTITAINGTQYNTQSYFGQPTGDPATTTTLANRKYNSAQFAYLNFIPQGSTEIGSVTINETGATFESDNYAVLTSAPSPLDSFVTLGTVGAVPEPSSFALAGVGLIAFLWVQRIRQSRSN